MMTIRCTRELLKLLGVEGNHEANQRTNLLGDFYAKLVLTRRGTLTICVSERSLLPVLVAPLPDPRMFGVTFRQALQSVLREIGGEPGLVRHEVRETEQIGLGKTSSRRILGSLNDLAFLDCATIEDDPGIDLLALAVELADTPCSPLNDESPKSASLTLLRRGYRKPINSEQR
jgi:hypothetical protein